VAIKVLSAHVASDPDFRQRFEREGRAVAALNHPHICTLHDIGHQDDFDYLVTEYLEGQTLAGRLEKGPLPVDQVLRYAVRMVDAIDKAHRQGIIHRDLKPANIMLTKAGVKLLDFGLAKATASSVAASNLSMLPTTPPVTRQPQGEPLTAQGTILGTFQYMAPEQLEGKEADARSDIFAFGCVLYEMLTARKAFEGKTHASLIGAIMHAEPSPISDVQPLAPPALEPLVRTCLAKDPDDRYQTAHDLLLTMRSINAAPSMPAPAAASPRRWRRLARYATAIAIVAVASSVATWLAMPAVSPSAMRFTIATPPTEPFTTESQAVNLAVQSEVWVRPYPGPGAPVRVSPSGGTEPIWARSGRELYYLEGDKLMTVAVELQPAFRFKSPALVFEARYLRGGQPPSYDVASDGRFLMLKSSGPRAAAAEIVVVQNWLEELKQRVPVK
jgi:serine/threonine protein kinase